MSGYLGQKPTSRTSLAVTVALHVGGVAALFSIRPFIATIEPKAIPAIAIDPLTPPPPVPVDPPKTKAKAPTKPINYPTERQTTSRPTIDRPVEVTLIDGPVMADLPRIPIDRPIIEPDVPAVPVLTAPSDDPRYAGTLQPPYPLALQRAEQEGSVTVRVRIAPDGRVIEVQLVSADAEAFFTATRDWALRKWRFRPATRDGVTVEGWRTKTVHFKIVS